MKKVAFVVSHLCSGSDTLVEILNENSRVQISNTGFYYDHPTVLNHLYNSGHKWDTSAAIYGDHLLYNNSFSCKELYPICKFIYLVRRPDETLRKILYENSQYTPQTACRYYCFRLRRICEMARSTPGAVFITFDKLGEGLALIDEYLNLKTPLVYKEPPQINTGYVPSEILDTCDKSYERHLYYAKNIDLRYA